MKKFTKKFITLFLASLILLVPFSFGEEVGTNKNNIISIDNLDEAEKGFD